MTSVSATCIVPFYNEEKNILYVLQELVTLPFLTQIICIDDGSTDNSASEILKHFPQVELVRVEKNSGKSFAVKKGLDLSIYDRILLFDADIKNIVPEEITTSFNLFTLKPIDMLILGRECPNKLLRMMRGDIVVSGERWLKKEDLQQVFQEFTFKGFQLEMAINTYMGNHKKRSYWFQTSSLNTFKNEKYGLWGGIASTIQETMDVFTSKDFSILRQLMTFQPKKITAKALL